MALAMFRKRVGSDRTDDRKVSQSWTTRSWRTSLMELNMVENGKVPVGIMVRLFDVKNEAGRVSSGYGIPRGSQRTPVRTSLQFTGRVLTKKCLMGHNISEYINSSSGIGT